jgi:hypothetical protein
VIHGAREMYSWFTCHGVMITTGRNVSR